MKKIKFRAWDEDGFMFVPTMIEFNKNGEGDTLVWLGDTFGQLDSACVDLMPYTGLKDKNGKEIYEGDIVKLLIGREDEINPIYALTYKIEWKNACYGFIATHPNEHVEEDQIWKPFWKDQEMWNEEFFEVIGNIYENPELL